MRNGDLQSVITIPVCCFFLLLTLFCSSFGLLQAFQSFSVNLPSIGSPWATIPLRHVCQGLQQGCQLHHGLSRVYREVPAPPGHLQGHRAISAWDRLCLAWSNPSVSSQGSPLQLPSPSAPWAPIPSTEINNFLFQNKFIQWLKIFILCRRWSAEAGIFPLMNQQDGAEISACLPFIRGLRATTRHRRSLWLHLEGK